MQSLVFLPFFEICPVCLNSLGAQLLPSNQNQIIYFTKNFLPFKM
jgi:hypothetical protein